MVTRATIASGIVAVGLGLVAQVDAAPAAAPNPGAPVARPAVAIRVDCESLHRGPFGPGGVACLRVRISAAPCGIRVRQVRLWVNDARVLHNRPAGWAKPRILLPWWQRVWSGRRKAVNTSGPFDEGARTWRPRRCVPGGTVRARFRENRRAWPNATTTFRVRIP